METSKVIRVLVVEDFKSFRDWISTKLKKQSHLEIVGAASGGQEAIRMAYELNPDLVLLDMGLPDINGIETEKQIFRALPSAKVLFLSGCAQQEIVEAALHNGARGYVLKAEAERELLPAIESVLNGNIFVSNSLRRGDSQPSSAQLTIVPWPA